MYIGRGVDAISNVEKLDLISFSGSTATFNLTKNSVAFTPVSAEAIRLSIDGVEQGLNYSVSGSTIIFDFTPSASSTMNWIYHIGVGVLNTPADGSVSLAKMAANSVDSDQYVDLSIDTAHIGALQVTGAKLNTDVISAQTALAVAPADTDEFMVSDAGVLKRIDYSLIKGGGITEADTWRVTTNFQGNAEPIASNWERDDTDANINLGTGMTESSGIFTFPSTGVYEVIFIHTYSGAGDNQYIESRIDATTDNSSYSNASKAWGSAAGNGVYGTSTLTKIIDVTNTTNTKVRFSTTSQDTDAHTQTASDQNLTYITFKRIGDT